MLKHSQNKENNLHKKTFQVVIYDHVTDVLLNWHMKKKKSRTPYKVFLILQLLMFQQNKDLAVKGLMGNRIKVATDFNQNAFFKARNL